MDSIPTLAEYIARPAGVPGASCPNLPNTYIGMRYVPEFADPVEWDATMQTEYEYLKIVTYQGNSYTSRTWVPKNIPITNTDYWILTGNYNAQVEAYRQEVLAIDGRITAVKNEYDELEPMVRNNSISINTLDLYTQTRLSDKNIAIYGDSISAGYPGGESWSVSFEAYLNSIGSTLVNKAHGGDTIQLVAEQITSDENLQSYDLIIVQCGTNNIGGTPESTLSQCKLLASALNAYKKDIILITPFPRNDTYIGSQGMPLAVIRNIMYNTFHNLVTIIDGAAFPKPMYWVDGLHPTTASSKKISEFIKRAINSYSDVLAVPTFGYVNIEATCETGNITTCQGTVNGMTCNVVINGTLRVPRGIKFHILEIPWFQSWIKNPFINRHPVQLFQLGGTIAPAVINVTGGTIQLITNAETEGTYEFTAVLTVPNMFYI